MILVFVEWQHVSPQREDTISEGKHDSCLCRQRQESCFLVRYLTGTCCHSTKTRIMFPLVNISDLNMLPLDKDEESCFLCLVRYLRLEHAATRQRQESCFPSKRYLAGACCHSTKTRIVFPLVRYLEHDITRLEHVAISTKHESCFPCFRRTISDWNMLPLDKARIRCFPSNDILLEHAATRQRQESCFPSNDI